MSDAPLPPYVAPSYTLWSFYGTREGGRLARAPTARGAAAEGGAIGSFRARTTVPDTYRQKLVAARKSAVNQRTRTARCDVHVQWSSR